MASSAAPERSNLESLLPPAEAALLRLSDESKHLTNELVDLRFKHYVIDDQATALSNRILHLDALIAKDASDRAFLEAHGSLPPPSLPAASSKDGGGGGASR